MPREPFRTAPALFVVVGAGLTLQLVVWLSFGGAANRTQVLLALAATALSFFVALNLLRRALRALALSAARLQEIAIGWESGRAVSAPSLAATDHSLRELEGLRTQLVARFTQEQKLRQQVEDASAFKTGFLRSVRHELRTPLNAVLGFSEVLLSGMEGPLTAGQRENLTVIARTGARLSDLFDEVIELATMAAGQLELRADAVEVLALLEGVGEAVEGERGQRAVHIRVVEPEQGLVVAGDGERLKRLLRGIASQALAVLHAEELVLSAEAYDARVRLCVRDHARKLTAEELDGLLGSRPSELRRKGLDEGSRLRIAIWRQLAALFDGKVELQSDAQGTQFVLDLPAYVPVRAAVDSGTAPALRGGTSSRPA
jgi:signal transduction histidine kinase